MVEMRFKPSSFVLGSVFLTSFHVLLTHLNFNVISIFTFCLFSLLILTYISGQNKVPDLIEVYFDCALGEKKIIGNAKACRDLNFSTIFVTEDDSVVIFKKKLT